MRIKKLLFWLWIAVISASFAFDLYFAEHNVKMHTDSSFGVLNLCLALVTAVVFGVLKLLGKTEVHWFFIPLIYAFAGVAISIVYSRIPCCAGG